MKKKQKEREGNEKVQLRNAQADCQRLSRELNEEMSVNTSALYDAKRVSWIFFKKQTNKWLRVDQMFFQDTEDEIASIKLQFEPLVQEKNSVDAQNQVYLAEMNEIKKKINDFTETRNQLRVRLRFFFWIIMSMLYE